MNLSFHRNMLLLAISVAFSSNIAFGDVVISDIKIENNLYSGLKSTVSLAVSSDTTINDGIIYIGLNSIDPELSDEENKSISTPEFYIASIPFSVGNNGKLNITKEIEIPPISGSDGEYNVSAVVDNVSPISGDLSAEVIDEAEVPTVSSVYTNYTVQYQTPTLPSLEISTASIAGDSGYTISKDNANEIKVNVELLSRTKDVKTPLETKFSLSLPGGAEYPLTVQTDTLPQSDTWKLTPDCNGCSTLNAETTKGADLALQLSAEVKSALSNMQAGEIVSLHIIADSSNTVDEWNSDKSDNVSTLSLFVTE